MDTYKIAHDVYVRAIRAGSTEIGPAILNLLREPVEFSFQLDAEQYVDQNPYGHAKVFANKMRPAPSLPERVLVSEFFGKEYK